MIGSGVVSSGAGSMRRARSDEYEYMTVSGITATRSGCWAPRASLVASPFSLRGVVNKKSQEEPGNRFGCIVSLYEPRATRASRGSRRPNDVHVGLVLGRSQDGRDVPKSEGLNLCTSFSLCTCSRTYEAD